MILSPLNALFVGPLEGYRDRIVSAEDPRPSVRGADLLDPRVLTDQLDRFARTFAAPEPRAVASIWAKQHFSMLVVPALAANIVLDLVLPVALDAVEIVPDDGGLTRALKLRDPAAGSDGPGGHTGARAPADRFGALIDAHLAPLVGALAAVSGVAPRVLWSNAGNIFEFVVRRTEGLPQAGRTGHAAAASVLTSRRRSGVPNPLFAPIRYVPEAGDAPAGAPPRRVRKVCCLRYLIPDQSLCGACPLPARPEAGPAGTDGPRRPA